MHMFQAEVQTLCNYVPFKEKHTPILITKLVVMRESAVLHAVMLAGFSVKMGDASETDAVSSKVKVLLSEQVVRDFERH